MTSKQEDSILRGYELCLIINPETPDTDVEALVNDIAALITSRNGTVLKHEKWGKKNLKFPIKKQTKGNYSFLCFMAEPPVLRDIDRAVRYNESVMRYAVMALGEDFSPEKLVRQAPTVETAAAAIAEAADAGGDGAAAAATDA